MLIGSSSFSGSTLFRSYWMTCVSIEVCLSYKLTLYPNCIFSLVLTLFPLHASDWIRGAKWRQGQPLDGKERSGAKVGHQSLCPGGCWEKDKASGKVCVRTHRNSLHISASQTESLLKMFLFVNQSGFLPKLQDMVFKLTVFILKIPGLLYSYFLWIPFCVYTVQGLWKWERWELLFVLVSVFFFFFFLLYFEGWPHGWAMIQSDMLSYCCDGFGFPDFSFLAQTYFYSFVSSFCV